MKKLLRKIYHSNSLIESTARPFISIARGGVKRLKSDRRSLRIHLSREKEYHKWFIKNFPSGIELIRQKNESENFKIRPKISILVPTYNTDKGLLIECIESVLAQSYFNWELCIADDASSEPYIKEVLSDYSNRDGRIKVVMREKNGHICKATNSALKVSSGDFLALLDHDDYLWPNALYEVVKAINANPDAEFLYTDEDKIEQDGRTHVDPFFKPDWSFDYLRSINYITHFSVLKRNIMEEIGGFREGTHGAQDWDLFLRASLLIKKENIIHVPKLVYSWRKIETSTALNPDSKNYAFVNQKSVLEYDLKNRGLKGEVAKTQYLGYWQVKYALQEKAKVSIIIPTKNKIELLQKCIESITSKTLYDNYEIVVVDTGSTSTQIKNYYKQLEKNKNIKIIHWKGKQFNYSSACNFGAESSKGDYLLFLNNDTEVLTPDWIEQMLMYAQLEDVGAVGVKLLYPNQHIQHSGIILGLGEQDGKKSIGGHIFSEWDDRFNDGTKSLYTDCVRNYTAVTAACLMVKRTTFNKVEGFDEKLKIAYNDIDLCLKLRKIGLRNLVNPNVAIKHHESASVGDIRLGNIRKKQFKEEQELMYKKWGKNTFDYDPMFNPNLRKDNPYAFVNQGSSSSD